MATFRTILTSYGLERLAQATAAGVPINLTHMAVGDGNGSETVPLESQSQLVREVFRAPVNRVYQDASQATRFITELIIPAANGGYVIRELGVFDDSGGLFAVGNVPATYKPTPSEGAFSDAAVRTAFIATNATVITLQIDPNVAVATQQWIINNITAATLIPGGTTGQYLAKASNADGAYAWVSPDDVSIVVDVIEEPQTLADAQTTVTWNVVTNRGLAVYIEGVRLTKGLGADQWREDPAQPDTRIILGKSYPASTQIIGTQNEPSGSVPFPLIRDQNLADVPDKAAGRANLDVFNKAETRQMAPPSEVAYFARSTAPAGWLKANGAAVSRIAYADLFAAIGTTYGAGDGFNTFNLPDLRGEFLRGWSDGRGIDVGRGMGSAQGHAIELHNHFLPTSTDGVAQLWGISDAAFQKSAVNPFPAPNYAATTYPDPKYVNGLVDTGSLGNYANETRPRNVALLACIKF